LIPDGGGGLSMSNESQTDSFDWDELLALIEEGKVIPVIGEGLGTVSDVGGQRLLYDVIADRLRVNLNIDDGDGALSLHKLACSYVGNDLTRLDSLYAKIKANMPRPGELGVPGPLLKLAAIRHFRLYVTTTFDPMLTAALAQARYPGTPIDEANLRQPPFDVFSYRPGKPQDLPCEIDLLERPVVYHLFGKVSSTPDYAVTDEDVLEFIHSLQSREQQPRLLFEALSTHRLLIVGCRFTNWLARFFLRMARADRLRMPGKADYLVDRVLDADQELVVFLQHFGGGTRIVRRGALEFVDELHERWTQRYGTALPPAPGPKARDQAGTLFLSYASEDRDVVQKLRDLLQLHGLPVWFDKDRLRGGDRWAEVLRETIDHCSVFVPIISRHCLTPETREFRAEWERAFLVAKERPANARFLNPVAIDDVSDQDPRFPEALRAIQWRRFPRGDIDRALIEDLTVAHKSYSPPDGTS
jgi:hypothetical protein